MPAMSVTIIVGHLVIQVVTMHVDPDAAAKGMLDPQPKRGDWETTLTPIWPIELQDVMWPPKVTFTNGGKNQIAKLMDRWRIGNNVG
jgi:hypothetical protein